MEDEGGVRGSQVKSGSGEGRQRGTLGGQGGKQMQAERAGWRRYNLQMGGSGGGGDELRTAVRARTDSIPIPVSTRTAQPIHEQAPRQSRRPTERHARDAMPRCRTRWWTTHPTQEPKSVHCYSVAGCCAAAPRKTIRSRDRTLIVRMIGSSTIGFTPLSWGRGEHSERRALYSY